MLPQDPPPLTTERVTNSRRAPLVVGLAVLVVVGMLVWRPWGATPVATPSPSPIAFKPPPTQIPIPIASVEPLPAPTPAATPSVLDVFVTPVTCIYAAGESGGQTLSAINVEPPFVGLGAAGMVLDIRRLGWGIEIQTNALDTLFTAEWQTVYTSRPQLTALNRYQFKTISVPGAKLPTAPTLVARVVVSVGWYGPHRTLLGSEAVVPTQYSDFLGTLDTGGSWPEGCHAST